MRVGKGSGKRRIQSECLERHQALVFWHAMAYTVLALAATHGAPARPPSLQYPSVNPLVDIVVFVAVAKSRLLNSGNGNANSRTKGAEALATGKEPIGGRVRGGRFQKCKSN